MRNEYNNKFVKRYTKLLAILAVVLWSISYLGSGMTKVYSWLIVIILLPAISLLSMFATILPCLIKRCFTREHLTLTGLCVLLFLPIGGVLGLFPLKYPADANSHVLEIPSPFIEDVHYVPLGENRAHNPWPQERLAYDVLATPYDHGAMKNQDYGIWDMAVYSPVAGEVVGVCNNQEDIAPSSEDFTSFAGNYVYIKVEETSTYLIFAHLKQGSVEVNAGDRVEPGDILGHIGNSGTTSEPHLHLQHQRQNPNEVAYPLFAEGLPLKIQGNLTRKTDSTF